MEPCGAPFIATPPFCDFDASKVPWKPETEKTDRANYTIQNKNLHGIYKKNNLYCL
jgi:hypothetical protein